MNIYLKACLNKLGCQINVLVTVSCWLCNVTNFDVCRSRVKTLVENLLFSLRLDGLVMKQVGPP